MHKPVPESDGNVRLRAAEACSLLASSSANHCPTMVAWDLNDLECTHEVQRMAQNAFDAIAETGIWFQTIREMWAEAECLLRSGWTPGGDVHVIIPPKAEALPELEEDLYTYSVDAPSEDALDCVTVSYEDEFPEDGGLS